MKRPSRDQDDHPGGLEPPFGYQDGLSGDQDDHPGGLEPSGDQDGPSGDRDDPSRDQDDPSGDQDDPFKVFKHSCGKENLNKTLLRVPYVNHNICNGLT